MKPIIRLATINILNDLSRWPGRRALLADGLGALSADVIALQEVTHPLGESPAHWLAGELGGYSVSICPQAGRGRSREGIAILSRLPVEHHDTLDLRGQRRMAQRVRVRLGGRSVAIVNGHYYWPPGAGAAQARQVGLVLDWLKDLPAGTPVVSCGDFNCTPRSRAIALMKRSFASAHEARHGREPDYTCPTSPMVYGNPVHSTVARGFLRLMSNRPGGSWRATLDYIFATPDVRVVECGVILDRPAPGDPGLYASDHLGLSADLEIGGSDPVSEDGALELEGAAR